MRECANHELFMAYTSSLTTGEQLQIENQGTQTVITLSQGGQNQQQRQRSSLTTGEWLQPPTLFSTGMSAVLRIEATTGQFFIQLQSGSISTLNTAPSLLDADILPLQKTADQVGSNQNNIPPMRPMEPMKMGNMEMQTKPMQMRMGNMQMQIGKTESSTSTKRFCSQCGEEVSSGDRFCTHCGHRLSGE